MGARLHTFPTTPHSRRRRMAVFLECAARCYSAAAKEADDAETVTALLRAADRYVAGFNALADGRAA
jgi:hypothetical protein